MWYSWTWADYCRESKNKHNKSDHHQTTKLDQNQTTKSSNRYHTKSYQKRHKPKQTDEVQIMSFNGIVINDIALYEITITKPSHQQVFT